MPLTTPAIVEADGGLIWQLFSNIPATGVVDQTTLDTFVMTKIVIADSWMRRRLLANYNLPGDPNAQIMQAAAQSYLTLHYLVPILEAARSYGIHYPFESEDHNAYDSLVERAWKEEAISLLDEWITVEQVSPVGFAMPTFGFSQPVPIVSYDDSGPTGLDPQTIQLEEALSQARGRVVPFPGGSIGR